MDRREMELERIVKLLSAVLSMVAVLCVSGSASAQAAQASKTSRGVIKVMTRDLYLGARIDPVAEATAPALVDFIDRYGKALRTVDANNFNVRARGLANEIRRSSPDLVGLQDVALWRTGPAQVATPLDGSITTDVIHVDFLDELMYRLNQRRKLYRVVHVQKQSDFDMPADYNGAPGDGPPGENRTDPNGEINARLTLQDVIIARNGAGVKVRTTSGAAFTSQGSFPYARDGEPSLSAQGDPTFEFVPLGNRGWNSAEVKVRRSPWFRFVNTQLEDFSQFKVRTAQATELVSPGGPMDSGSMPAILVGSLNTGADMTQASDRLAYSALLAGGLRSRIPKKLNTCCIASEVLTTRRKKPNFTSQTDHILVSHPRRFQRVKTVITGNIPGAKLWNSDHAGVVSSLRILP